MNTRGEGTLYQSHFKSSFLFQGGVTRSLLGGATTDRIYSSFAGGVLDSEGFAVHSNVKFLYLIGKICCETGQFPEESLSALNDYLSLIDYFKDDVPEDTYNKLKLKTLFCIGMIFYKQKDYE
jgi:hypothetical protein